MWGRCLIIRNLDLMVILDCLFKFEIQNLWASRLFRG